MTRIATSSGSGASLARVRARLLPLVEELFSSAFFRALSSGNFPKTLVPVFLGEYGILNDAFPRLLACALFKMPDDQSRAPFLANLWDEHGCGDLSKSHRTLYERVATHFSCRCLVGYGPGRRYVDSFLTFLANADVPAVYGALGPGCEWFTSRQYVIINRFLEDSFSPPQGVLEFFTEHIVHDVDHDKWIGDVAGLTLVGEGQWAQFETGARRALQLELSFWNELYDYCYGAMDYWQ